jgi:DNA adenine methylase
MPKYTCERCLKEFSQKSHYTKHQNKKIPCQDNKGKIEEIVENIINKKLISSNNVNINTNTTNMEIMNVVSESKESSHEQLSENTIVAIDSYEHNENYMKEYLDTIRKSDGTFKRVLISPLRYAGGKSKAIGLILNSLPKLRNKRIVSPFFGGGSFELCVSQKLDIEVIGYDIFGMLTNFWNVFINHKDEFIQELKKFKITREEFTYNRHVLLNYWEKIKPKDLVYNARKKVELAEEDLTILDNNIIKQAVYYYYNMTLSYGPMFLGWPSSNEIKPDKFNRRIKKFEKMNLKNISVQCDDFENVIPRHNDDFLFLDPPYYLEGDSKMFKGLYPNCNFAIHHNNFNHKKMCELLKNHKGGFLITYNNCDTIREWYKDFKFEFPKWQYTYGQGEKRIGKNRKKDKTQNIKESHEIFIICYPK